MLKWIQDTVFPNFVKIFFLCFYMIKFIEPGSVLLIYFMLRYSYNKILMSYFFLSEVWLKLHGVGLCLCWLGRAGPTWQAVILSWISWLEWRLICPWVTHLLKPITCLVTQATGGTRSWQFSQKNLWNYSLIPSINQFSLVVRMATTDLDDFIPPAPPMQAPGLPSFEASPWDTYERSSTSQGECPTIIRKQRVNS